LDEKDQRHLVALTVVIAYADLFRQQSVSAAASTRDCVPEYFILEHAGKEYKGTYNTAESLVKLTGDSIDPVDIPIYYKWSFGDKYLETMIDSESTSAKLIKKNYDGYVLMFNSNIVEVKVFTELQHKLSKTLNQKPTETSDVQLTSELLTTPTLCDITGNINHLKEHQPQVALTFHSASPQNSCPLAQSGPALEVGQHALQP